MKKLIQTLVLTALVAVGFSAQAGIASFEIPSKIARQCDLIDPGAHLGITWFGTGTWEGWFETQLANGVTVIGYGRITAKFGRRGIQVSLEADYLEFGGECVFTNVRMSGAVLTVN